MASGNNKYDRRVAFVSTRIRGTDGVTLEIAKWASVIERAGIECFFITGASDRPANRTALIPEAHFNHPEILDISQRAFGTEKRDSRLTDDIIRLARKIRTQLNEAINQFNVDAIIAENALTIPMNIPLGLALVEAIQEQQIGCVAHHHDFYWERDRFLVNAVDDFLHYAFPPALAQIQHVVINSPQSEEFSRRTGLSCRIVPNVMDFANPPVLADGYSKQFRSAIGLEEDDILFLQPTRVVARKGIEHAIEVVRRLNLPNAKLVISHESGDEGNEYLERIREYAELLDVDVRYVADWIRPERGTGPDGRLLFTLQDVFSQADFVTYPSEYEGFGNAFLEAIYYKKPVICNRYTIYRMDIEPCGFNTIVFDGFLRNATIDHIRRVLDDGSYRQEMVDTNYEIARKYFSYEVLEAELRLMVERPHNVYRLIGRSRR
ncbi:MAG: glycosyltransferase family 4 protein [Pirellulales bacterium]|nr:glycosyltransferase family 4 protein [Pirellulales bacterium]